ncbi:MAG TPA: tetraacyldisaccharide 4'-kinase [Bryobacteraceae bacterium]
MALYLLYRGIKDRRYFAGLAERLGFLPASLHTTGSGAIWFHAVSVGEVLSAVELIRRLKQSRPNATVFLSTTTLAGRATAHQRLSHQIDGIFFAPLDYRSIVRRVLRRLRPSAVVIVETEIWPNLYREAKRAGASLLVANGRISDRAFPRYQSWRGFFKHVLCWPDVIYAQSDRDAQRYIAAGAPGEKVHTAGNLKYDFTPPTTIAPDLAAFLDRVGPARIWIAASTMPPRGPNDPDEDDVVIAAFASLRETGTFLILAPRRPERFESTAQKLIAAQIPFARRTQLSNAPARPEALLLDSIGELAALFQRAAVTFMGGTLASRGGHNILEPSYFATPVIAGPHMENFADMAGEFTNAGALLRIDSANQLAEAVSHAARETGLRAQTLAASKRGAITRIAAAIEQAADAGLPNAPHTLAARLFLTPLSGLWTFVHLRNIANKRAGARQLRTKVVSIGGLTMGGAGKSPIAAHLAASLRAAGRNPAILTRGYRRKSHDPIVIVPRGETAAVYRTGDEAQIFLREANAHVGIGGDRFAVGQSMESQLLPDLFLLDDGFQHVRLKREQDIVLIDALDPLAGGMFPLGRRREPLESLARATAIIVTRADFTQSITAIERLVRRYNAKAPIYRSRVLPLHWTDFETGTQHPIAKPGFRRVAAFCGLGSPQTFWRTLDELGLEVAFRWAFGDHHPYRPSELQRLAKQASAAGAEAFVTTEKDIMNLCEGASAILAPHKLYWLKIGVEIENEEQLLRRLL